MGTLTLDASSPAIVWNGSDTTAISGSFNPPANSLIVLAIAANSGAGNTPVAAFVSDSRTPDLTWVLVAHSVRGDGVGADGQATIYKAQCATSGAMTITVTSDDAATGIAIKVWVFTDSAGGYPAVGAEKAAATTSTSTARSDSVTAEVNNSRGVLVYADWAAGATPTAGTGCTLTGGGAANQSPTLAYAFLLRTANDGSVGNPTTMNWNSGSGGANRWAIAEVTPVADDPPTTPGTPSVSNITQTTADVTWTASTDDVGVSRYDVVIEPD